MSARANAGRFINCTGLVPQQVLTVRSRDAFPRSYDEHEAAWRAFDDDDVIIITAGPVGRLLAVHWHTKQPRATYLELGSFFDPDLADEPFFGKRRGALDGARYYPRVQCGRALDPSVYQPKVRFAACQAGPRDVRANKIDEKKLLLAAASGAAR